MYGACHAYPGPRPTLMKPVCRLCVVSEPRKRGNALVPNSGSSVWSICTEYAGDVYGAWTDYEWNMYGICMEYAWNMYGICMEDAWKMYGICMEYAWNM